MESHNYARAFERSIEYCERPNIFIVRISALWIKFFLILVSYNNVKAIDEQAVQIRTDSNINIGGLYFS